MEIIIEDYKYKDNNINIKIKHNSIVGIIGDSKNLILEILKLKQSIKGNIRFNNEKINKSNIYEHQKKISIIKEEFDIENENILTINFLYNVIKKRNLKIKNCYKKVKDSLKILNLDENILNKKIYELSSSEKKLLQYSASLLSNPEIIIIKEPFKYLDIKNEKKVIMLLQRLKDQFDINIIFITNDSNILFKYTDYTIICKNDKIIAQGSTENIFKRVSFLNKNKINVPSIVKFVYDAQEIKNVKLDYQKDIRDLIKDIYKHV